MVLLQLHSHDLAEAEHVLPALLVCGAVEGLHQHHGDVRTEALGLYQRRRGAVQQLIAKMGDLGIGDAELSLQRVETSGFAAVRARALEPVLDQVVERLASLGLNCQ